jgi:hypothetical protein
MPDQTERIVDACDAAWGSGDVHRVGALLTEDLRFRGPMGDADGPAAFVDRIRRNAPMFGAVRVTDRRRIVDEQRVVSRYPFESGPTRVPMAEAFDVRGDRNARVDLSFDPSPRVRGAAGQ